MTGIREKGLARKGGVIGIYSELLQLFHICHNL